MNPHSSFRAGVRLIGVGQLRNLETGRRGVAARAPGIGLLSAPERRWPDLTRIGFGGSIVGCRTRARSEDRAAPNASDHRRRALRDTFVAHRGIIPALESAHAIAYAMRLAATMPKEKILLVNLSGRGDKDMGTVAERSGLTF